jgi:hypothetical protein
MLRPADWLPPKRLLTPRLGHATLITRLGSATRRSGAYRGGTFTRWRRTTGYGRSRVRIVTTHHMGDFTADVWRPSSAGLPARIKMMEPFVPQSKGDSWS